MLSVDSAHAEWRDVAADLRTFREMVKLNMMDRSLIIRNNSLCGASGIRSVIEATRIKHANNNPA